MEFGFCGSRRVGRYGADRPSPAFSRAALAGVSCVPTTAKLAQHAAQDENPFAMILPVAMGANISGVITSAIIAGIFVATSGMLQ